MTMILAASLTGACGAVSSTGPECEPGAEMQGHPCPCVSGRCFGDAVERPEGSEVAGALAPGELSRSYWIEVGPQGLAVELDFAASAAPLQVWLDGGLRAACDPCPCGDGGACLRPLVRRGEVVGPARHALDVEPGDEALYLGRYARLRVLRSGDDPGRMEREGRYHLSWGRR